MNLVVNNHVNDNVGAMRPANKIHNENNSMTVAVIHTFELIRLEVGLCFIY